MAEIATMWKRSWSFVTAIFEAAPGVITLERKVKTTRLVPESVLRRVHSELSGTSRRTNKEIRRIHRKVGK